MLNSRDVERHFEQDEGLSERVPKIVQSQNRNGKAHDEPKKVLFETMTTVDEEEIDWLWKNRIPRGKLTLFDGDPGVGKSFVSLAIAATISKGDALPFDSEPEAPLRSWIINAEDGPADTIKPRLRKLGADMNMIAIPKRELNFTPNQITPQLIDTFLVEFPAALLIIDPIIAYAGKRNTDKASDVRDLLTPLALVAEKHKTAIVLISHLVFAADCRSAFVFTYDGSNRERRLMAHTKGSVAGFQPTLEFFIDDQGVFRWGQQRTETADDALGSGESKGKRDSRELDAAKKFLEDFLAAGPMASEKVKEVAGERGISNKTLWRAKTEMGIGAKKAGVTGEWVWRLT
jgi:hypothetical protein